MDAGSVAKGVRPKLDGSYICHGISRLRREKKSIVFSLFSGFCFSTFLLATIPFSDLLSCLHIEETFSCFARDVAPTQVSNYVFYKDQRPMKYVRAST